eukprot:Rhum_TRINITY_DN13670_c0_g2::Rhum_TRINITY_DN13670_c0_g2_i1::g.62676::m.62676
MGRVNPNVCSHVTFVARDAPRLCQNGFFAFPFACLCWPCGTKKTAAGGFSPLFFCSHQQHRDGAPVVHAVEGSGEVLREGEGGRRHRLLLQRLHSLGDDALAGLRDALAQPPGVPERHQLHVLHNDACAVDVHLVTGHVVEGHNGGALVRGGDSLVEQRAAHTVEDEVSRVGGVRGSGGNRRHRRTVARKHRRQRGADRQVAAQHHGSLALHVAVLLRHRDGAAVDGEKRQLLGRQGGDRLRVERVHVHGVRRHLRGPAADGVVRQQHARTLLRQRALANLHHLTHTLRARHRRVRLGLQPSERAHDHLQVLPQDGRGKHLHHHLALARLRRVPLLLLQHGSRQAALGVAPPLGRHHVCDGPPHCNSLWKKAEIVLLFSLRQRVCHTHPVQ